MLRSGAVHKAQLGTGRTAQDCSWTYSSETSIDDFLQPDLLLFFSPADFLPILTSSRITTTVEGMKTRMERRATEDSIVPKPEGGKEKVKERDVQSASYDMRQSYFCSFSSDYKRNKFMVETPENTQKNKELKLKPIIWIPRINMSVSNCSLFFPGFCVSVLCFGVLATRQVGSQLP